MAGKVSYWLVAEVATWLAVGKVIDLPPEQAELYQAVWALNVQLEKMRGPNIEGLGDLLRLA